MKVAEKSKNKKDKVKKKGSVTKPKPKKEQVLVVAQEIKYARWLSGNDKKTRDRVLKALKKWLSNCFEKEYEFKEEDFTRVWKGLFYAVWMSDKPLIQEELCESIAAILDLFPSEQRQHGILMVKSGLKTLASEWYGIDHHRMDKFLMLVRRYLRGSLRLLKRCEWALEACQAYADMLSAPDGILCVQTPHYARNAASMVLHFVDCFLEELSKVSSGSIPETSLTALLRPFAVYTCSGTNMTLVTATRRLFTSLLRHSEDGIEYQNKTRAWTKMGCPEGGPDALEPASDDEQELETNGDGNSDGDDDDDESPLDPRAGRVSVHLRPLPVPAPLVAALFRDLLATAGSRAHRRIKICLERFESLSRGDFPLKVQQPPTITATKTKQSQSAKQLRILENKLKQDADELKLRGLSRKHRKRLLKKSRAGLSIVEEVDQLKKTIKNKAKSGEWLIESTETKEESNKENRDKNKKKVAQKRAIVDKQETVNKKQKLDKNLSKSTNKKDKVTNKTAEIKSTKDSVKDKVKKHKNQPQILDKKDKPTVAKVESDKSTIKSDKTNKVVTNKSEKKLETPNKSEIKKGMEKPTFVGSKVKKFPKPNNEKPKTKIFDTPKKVKFELKKNSMQKPIDYYKSVKQSPNIPFDSSKKPKKTNLKPSTPSPINPFFKKKLRMKN